MTLHEKVKCMLLDAKLPKHFLGEALYDIARYQSHSYCGSGQ